MTIRLALAFTALLFFQYFLDLLALRSVILGQINFYMDALTWVLDKSGADYHFINTDHSMSSQVRKVALVQKG